MATANKENTTGPFVAKEPEDVDTRIRTQLSSLVKDHPYATIGAVMTLVAVAYRSGKSDAIEELITTLVRS